MNWKSFRQHYLENGSLGFGLDFSRVGWPDGFIASKSRAMQSAFKEMKELEAGARANRDEDRRVGHYWLRAPERAPDDEIRNLVTATLADIHSFAKQVHSGAVAPEKGGRFTRFLLVGIGGSALGPQLADAVLSSPADPMAASFFDNTDPAGFDAVLDRIGDELSTTLTVVVSKSGGTKETRNGMLEAETAYTARGLDFARHAVAVTGPGSALDRHASTEGWIKRFPMPDWVGGRTSETSVVGLLPAALAGHDIDLFLDGARRMDEWTRSSEAGENPAALLALAWLHLTDGRGSKDMVILPYRDRLAPLSRYLQQLVMESLGKRLDRSGKVVHQGIAVYGNKGSTDQHAYVQQLRDGVNNFFATFIQVQEERPGSIVEVEPGVTSGDYLGGFLLGTRAALWESGRASITLTLDRLDAAGLGAVIALYERAVGLYASLVDINAYHQPGVEAGKKAASEVLELQARVLAALGDKPERSWSVEEIAERVAGNAETIFHILRRLAADPRRGVATEGEAPFDLRYRLEDRNRA